MKLAVQYRVKDAADYVFNVRDPDLTVQQVAESAIREVVGKSRMEFILTEGRDAVTQQAALLLQDTLDRYRTGIEVTSPTCRTRSRRSRYRRPSSTPSRHARTSSA